ncbi:hypothetical protein E4U55_001653 [Claviceps digitariae]|nr:hypothetical protein E4U55_001653 [Claviceps digitariae]
MPTYLCHGFRWYRSSIRPFIILNDLDECTPDWIIEPTTAAVLLSQLAESFAFVPRLEEQDEHGDPKKSPRPLPLQQPPARYDDDMSMPKSRVPPQQDRILMHDWSPVKLLEEYDQTETEHAARPYAYMADYVVRVDLGADVLAEMASYDETLQERNAAWFEPLREKVQPEEQARWYVVVCDDTEREAPVEKEEKEKQEEEEVDEEHEHHIDNNNNDGHPAMAAEILTESESGSAMLAQLRVMDDAPGELPVAATAAPCFYDNKALPSIPAQEQDQRGPLPVPVPAPDRSAPPAFLHQDPFESEKQPAGRLKKKLSLRRLFSKKEGWNF